MHSVLREMIDNKAIEVSCLSEDYPISTGHRSSLSQALSKPRSIIAEIKRRSPALGILSDIPDPAMLACQYREGGASAISVLTDTAYFKGCMDDLRTVSKAMAHSGCPVLRKDFIIDARQLAQAAAFGADAVLLIVAVLQDKTQGMIEAAERLGLEVLVEVHTREELSRALDTSAKIIGINNRDLRTLNVNIQTSLDLIQYMPSRIVSVSESGIGDEYTAKTLFDAGFSALLVGEALVRSADPGLLIQSMRGGRYD